MQMRNEFDWADADIDSGESTKSERLMAKDWPVVVEKSWGKSEVESDDLISNNTKTYQTPMCENP